MHTLIYTLVYKHTQIYNQHHNKHNPVMNTFIKLFIKQYATMTRRNPSRTGYRAQTGKCLATPSWPLRSRVHQCSVNQFQSGLGPPTK